MSVINLRGVPDELRRQVKATAASEGVTLREFVIGILERDIKRGGWTAAPEKRQVVKTALPAVAKKPQPVEAEVEAPAARSSEWRPTSQCQHGYVNSFACRRANGGC